MNSHEKIKSKKMNEDVKKLKEEIKILKMDKPAVFKYIIDRFFEMTKSSGGPQKDSILKEKDIESLSNSLMPFGVHHLKKLGRKDLLLIILYREANLFRIVNEYEESLKYNDRAVFNNLRDEIDRLKDESELAREIDILKKKVDNLDSRNRYLNNLITSDHIKNRTKEAKFKKKTINIIYELLEEWSQLKGFTDVKILEEFVNNIKNKLKLEE